MGVNGTFFDAKHAKMPATTPATFALHDPKGKDAQIFATQYTVNSALESGFTTGNTLDVTYLLSHFLKVTVTTDNLGVLIPQVLTKYGKGVPVEFSGKFIKAPTTTTMSTTGQSINGSLEITCTINKEVAILASMEDANAQATISSTGGKIFGNIGAASAGTIGAGFKTTLGLTADQLSTLLKTAIDSGIADLNVLLKAGVVIPEIAGIKVSNVEINFYEEYLEAGITLSAGLWEQFGNAMHMWKMYKIGKVAKTHHKRGFVARKFHQMKKFMK